jgi:hypothetical protein
MSFDPELCYTAMPMKEFLISMLTYYCYYLTIRFEP